MNVETMFRQFEEKISLENYEGWDIYDGLNSTLFSKTPFYSHRFFRLVWIQLFKRFPFNLRKIASIPKGKNPKGLALFLRGYINLFKANGEKKYLQKAYTIADALLLLRSAGRPYYCWGYNFPWQAKAFYVPAYKPNMVVSSTIAQAFLDLYEIDGNIKWLEVASDVGKFIDAELKLFEAEGQICYGYIPGESTRVHNANLMAASLFSRLFYFTQNSDYKIKAHQSIQYTADAQRKDGAWSYGENDHHTWVDNFHTGYNLVAIRDYQKYVDKEAFGDTITIGLSYHIGSHFTPEYLPKYYDTHLYPIDIHNYAQGIITFLAFGHHDKVERLVQNVLRKMYNERERIFYFQEYRFGKIKIPYMRWAQAWMFYALSLYIREQHATHQN